MRITLEIKIDCDDDEQGRLIQKMIDQTDMGQVVRAGLWSSGIGAPKAFRKALQRSVITVAGEEAGS